MESRILLVSDNYPPFIGGAHRQTQLLAHELAKRGYSVRVATTWQPGLPSVVDEDGVLVHRLQQMRSWLPWGSKTEQRHQPPFPDPVTIVALRRLLNDFQPDLIHAYGWMSYSLAVALWGKQIPLLLTGRDYAYSCATRTLVYRGESYCSGPAPRKCLHCAAHLYGPVSGWAAVVGVALGQRLLKQKVHGVHSISSFVQEIAERDFLHGEEGIAGGPGIKRVKAVIPSFRENGDTPDYTADPALQPYIERLPQEPYILFVGALRRVKGVQQLLDAYARLSAPPPLVLIGTFEADSPREFPPGVVVLENYPHRAVMAAWQRALFGVIPSLWPEPLGSVVYEGMSQGKALIGTKPGGHTDMLINGKTGLLIPLGNVDALTSAMARLLADPSLRERLGVAARKHAEQFTASVNVPRFMQLYAQVIQQADAGELQRQMPLLGRK